MSVNIPTDMNALLNCSVEEFLENEENLRNLLNNEENWKKFPLLNYTKVEDLKDYSLVRFRGMIQDMMNPEIYLEKYEVISKTNSTVIRVQNGKYRDCSALHSDNEKINYLSTTNVNEERQTFFIVSIPGINDWAEEYEKKFMAENCEKSLEKPGPSNYVPGKKRDLIDEDLGHFSGNSMIINKKLKKMDINAETENKDEDEKSNSLSPTYFSSLPLPDQPSKAVLIKLYSDIDSNVYPLNAVVDVIGFLSVEPEIHPLIEYTTEIDDLIDPEIEFRHPPPLLVPRIHVIKMKKLKHFNPLLDETYNGNLNENLNFELIFKDLKFILTQILFNDDLSAEYLLCHLISTVYVRTELETLGQFCMNLYNLPETISNKYTKILSDFIELLVPASYYFPMTLDKMNTTKFIPQKDYLTNKLTSGILQLSSGTHLILDETKLTAGKLEINGVKGVQSLANLIKDQKLKYDFKFYNIDFDTNIPVLILSEGRTMLPSNTQVPLNFDPDSVELIDETLKTAAYSIKSKLNLFRKYFTKCKLSQFSIDTALETTIENDFIEMRKTNKKVGANTLHSLLILSRLLGIAKGKTTLDPELWERAKEMENAREKRLEELSKKRQN